MDGADLFVRDEPVAGGDLARVDGGVLVAGRVDEAEAGVAGEVEGGEVETGLLAEFPDGRLPGRLAGVDPAAREFPLAAVAVEDQEDGRPVVDGGQCGGHRGVGRRVGRGYGRQERGQGVAVRVRRQGPAHGVRVGRAGDR
jgi:hypothetical protein